MKRLLFNILAVTLCTIACSATLSAQSINDVTASLETQGEDGAVVRVTEDRSSMQAVAAIESNTTKDVIKGYRVVIYYDNVQFAQDRAYDTHKDFVEQYPEINAYMVYEKPYFKVSVGDCLSTEEAMILLNKISHKYPKAFVRRDDISLDEIKNVRRRVDCIVLDSLQRHEIILHRKVRDSLLADPVMSEVMRRDSTINQLLELDKLYDAALDGERQ